MEFVQPAPIASLVFCYEKVMTAAWGIKRLSGMCKALGLIPCTINHPRQCKPYVFMFGVG